MAQQSRTIYVILGMLSIEPMTGYTIREEIKGSTGFFWSESDGQIYPALAKCVEEGYASVQEQGSPGAQKAKKLYKITKKGRDYLKSWLQESVRKSTARNELLLKLFFGANVPVEENIFHLQAYQKKLKQELKTFESIKKDLIDSEQDSENLDYWLITLDYGLLEGKSKLKWCENSLKVLRERS